MIVIAFWPIGFEILRLPSASRTELAAISSGQTRATASLPNLPKLRQPRKARAKPESGSDTAAGEQPSLLP